MNSVFGSPTTTATTFNSNHEQDHHMLFSWTPTKDGCSDLSPPHLLACRLQIVSMVLVGVSAYVYRAQDPHIGQIALARVTVQGSLALGVLIFVLSVVGYWGASSKNRCLLYVFFALLQAAFAGIVVITTALYVGMPWIDQQLETLCKDHPWQDCTNQVPKIEATMRWVESLLPLCSNAESDTVLPPPQGPPVSGQEHFPQHLRVPAGNHPRVLPRRERVQEVRLQRDPFVQQAPDLCSFLEYFITRHTAFVIQHNINIKRQTNEKVKIIL